MMLSVGGTSVGTTSTVEVKAEGCLELVVGYVSVQAHNVYGDQFDIYI